MNNISKVSDITYHDLIEYIVIDEYNEGDINTLNNLLTVAKTFITSYTGLKLAELDSYSDLVIAVMVLCQDMWDNRTLYVDTANISFVVQSVLDFHRVNLL